MSNQYLINYFNQNKKQFSQETLVLKLRSAGYPESDIKEALEIVFGRKPEKAAKKQSFWDFWHKKIYRTKKEKLLDFFLGLVGSPIFLFIFGYFIVSFLRFRSIYHIAFVILIYMTVSIYAIRKRRYIFWGMLIYWIIIFCLIIFMIFLFFSRLF